MSCFARFLERLALSGVASTGIAIAALVPTLLEPFPASAEPHSPGEQSIAQSKSPDLLKRITVVGVVRDAESRMPLEGARVTVQGAGITVTTTASGTFSLPPLVPRVYLLEVRAEGYVPAVMRVELLDPSSRPTLYLKKGEEKVHEVQAIEIQDTVIESPRPVERVITMKETQQVPGAFNDAVRVVENLPGVARNPLGVLIVRGTEPQDTGYYIDGIRVPLIFHILGLHTVVSSDVLAQVTFLPGNYGVRYGRTFGGVVDVAITEDVPFQLEGALGVDLLNAQALLKVPLSPTQGLFASFRRGYIDLVLEKGLDFYANARGESVDVGFYQAPSYYDYQVIYNQKLNERNFVHIVALGSKDAIRAVAEPPAIVPPEYRGDSELSANSAFHKLMGRWRYMGEDLTSLLTLSFGPDLQAYGFGAFRVNGNNLGLVAREDLRFRPSEWSHLTLRAGLDLFAGRYSFSLSLPTSPDSNFDDPFSQPIPYVDDIEGWYYAPAVYLEAEWDPHPRLKFIPGVRVDPVVFPDQYRTLWVDPRLSIQYRPLEKTLLKTSVGRFGDIPPPFAVDDTLGGAQDLLPPFSMQYSLGAEQQLTPAATLEMTAFLADLRRLVIIPSGPDAPEGPPEFTNDGRGLNRGLEVLLRHTPAKGFFGWISYTLLKAERLDGETPASEVECSEDDNASPCWYPFDYDQRHILTAVGSYKFKNGLTLGSRFRFSTGLPYTPLTTGYYDVDENSYEAFALPSDTNAARLPSFNDLTVRIDKEFKISKVTFDGYLEVINAYNRCNAEAVAYNYNYKEQAYVCGLPIFPNLGFKAMF